MQQFNCIEDLAPDPNANTTMFFIIEEVKEIEPYFLSRILRVF